jgi:spore maturation protein B
MSEIIILLLVALVILYSVKRKVPVYDAFLEGAKEGIPVVGRTFANLLAVIVAIGVARDSGLLDLFASLLSPLLSKLGIQPEILPLAIVKPISGSGASAVLSDIFIAYHPDSAIGKTASVMAGSTETTVYICALYFSSVGIKNTRYALPVALLADVIGMYSAIKIAAWLL